MWISDSGYRDIYRYCNFKVMVAFLSGYTENTEIYFGDGRVL